MTASPTTDRKAHTMSVSLIKNADDLFIADSTNFNRRQHEAMLARTERIELNTYGDGSHARPRPLVQMLTRTDRQVRDILNLLHS